MDAYSMDLRVRVIEAYDQGEGSQAELAKRFRVSERWLQKLLHKRDSPESIQPPPRSGGRPRVFDTEEERVLCDVLRQCPDASLDEIRERCGVPCCRMSVFRALQRLDFTRKKSPLSAPNS
jgi:transposase